MKICPFCGMHMYYINSFRSDEYECLWKNCPSNLRGEMRILIACEESGTVRDAFIKRGHDAVSCDIIPTSSPGPHIQGDVLEVLNDGWDMMIAFPPCTHLAVSGARWFKDKRREQAEAIMFFMRLAGAPVKRIAIAMAEQWG